MLHLVAGDVKVVEKRAKNLPTVEYRQITALWDSIDEPIYVSDPHTHKLLYINDAVKEICGETTGQKCHTVFQGLAEPCPFCTNKYIFGKNTGKSYIWEFKNKLNNHWYHCIDKAIKWMDGRLVRYEIAIDITKRKATEEQLRKSEEKYRTLVENADEGIIVAQQGMLEFVNPKIIEISGYAKEELTSRPFEEFIYAEDRPKVAKHNLRKLKNEEGPHIHSFRIIHKNGDIKWVKSNSVAILWNGRQATLSFLNDINEHKKVEDQLRQSLERLQRVIEGNIKAMAIAAEVRDPYTAGHQRRVSILACAIAQEMGLPKTQVDGIRVAAVLHDIGKINVPAEILSKPCKLSEMEMGIIKTHPKVGYDILKSEEFIWPIALIVLQHHERVDGSGYPQELSDGDILLEAKIIGVADVVEAMASHRPYRPALGTEKALEEISKNAGILYDRGAVKACLELFTKKSFRFD